MQEDISSLPTPPGDFDCIIIDGAATVHYLRPLSIQRDFLDYAQKWIIPYVEGMMACCDSLKTAVREKRWSGERYKVQANMKLPRKWSENKE